MSTTFIPDCSFPLRANVTVHKSGLLFFLENLAKAGKAIQAILDATGTRRGKIFTIILVLLLTVRSEQFCITLQK